MMTSLSRSSVIAVITFGFVIFSAVISLIWLITADGVSRFEPAVSGLGLLGGLAGILAERRATAQERRNLALLTLVDELHRDTEILADPRFYTNGPALTPHVYPRLPVSATDATLISGALAEHSDAELLGRLHNWRDEVNGFNRRLELTENRIFTTGAPAEVAEFERMLYRSDGYLKHVRLHLQDLQDYLSAHYQIVTKISGKRDVNDNSTRPDELTRQVE